MFYGLNILFTWLLVFATSAIDYSPSKVIKAFDLPNEIRFDVVDGLMILKIPSAGTFQNFIFDTGTEQLIFKDLAENTSSQIVSVDETYDISDIVVDRFSVGTLELKSVPAWGLDLAFLSDQLGLDIDGIVGAHLFHEFSVLIDYDQQVIKLIDQLSNPSIVAHEYNVVTTRFTQDKMDLPIIDVNIDGQLLKLGFDTGANICVFDHKIEAHISSCSNSSSELKNLKISNAIITQVPYLYKDLSQINLSRNTKIDGLISAEALATNKILIDSRRGKIFMLWKKSNPLISQ